MDSFFGGRVNETCLSYDVETDETIQYVDFTSLYPAVNKYNKYMVGHPQIIVRNFKPHLVSPSTFSVPMQCAHVV